MNLLPEEVVETEDDNKMIGNMKWKDLKLKLEDHKFDNEAFIDNPFNF